MPEVVDLISSDNESPAKSRNSSKKYATKPVAAPSKSGRPVAPVLHGKPQFDLTLDDEDDLPWPRRTKKRKLDSPPALAQPAIEVVTLEDSQDVLPLGSPRGQFDSKVEDDIEFTSPIQNDTQRTIWTTNGSQDELSEESPRPRKKSTLSSTTAALLEEITANGSKRHRKGTSKAMVKAIAEVVDDSEDGERSIDQNMPQRPCPKPSGNIKVKGADRAAKSLQKESERQDREARKEAEKQAKEAARALKKSEKQLAADLASVNRSKLNKNTTILEMLVDFPTSMNGLSCFTQAQEFLRKAECKISTYESAIPGVIKFRRRIESVWDEIAGHWVRVPEHIDNEKMIIMYLPAEEFARLVSPIEPEDKTYENHFIQLRNLHAQYRIIYLIESMEKLITREKNSQNRSYQAAVRRAAAAAEQQQLLNPAQPSRRKQNNVVVNEAAIEIALLKLQIHYKIQIHHTISPLDTGETILAMTQQLSQARYKDPPKMPPAKMAEQPNFCMASGQVPTGKTLEDSYLQILQRVIRVTEREATAIAKTYPNVAALYDAFKTRGGRVLQDIMKAGGGAKGPRDGSIAAERRIGPQTSERFGRILLGEDETALVK